MNEWIIKYKNMPFKERTLFNTKFSIFFNGFMAIAKFLIAIFGGVYFFVAGVVNIFIMVSKLECFLGVKDTKKSFKYRNTLTGIFLILAGTQYIIYMSRLLLTDVSTANYDMIIGIMIACVSFIEIGVAIKGLFNAYGQGHYYRNIKLISLASALTAIALTEVAITSFAAETDTRVLNGLFGVLVGAIIVLLGVFVLIAPKVSIVDREHNKYKLISNKELLLEKNVEIKLTDSKFYGNYFYKGTIENDVLDGHIVREKSNLFHWPIWINILAIVLSEILIFPYAAGALIYYFKNGKLIKKLDNIMLENNMERCDLDD